MTEIDSLQITIQSSSTSAASGIRDLSAALSELKKNGSIGTAVKNLKGLSEALKSFTTVTSNANKITQLATALEKLKSVGSLASLTSSVSKLPAALKGIQNIQLGSAEGKLKGLATALAPLSTVNTRGFNSSVNALAKLSDVTSKLDDATIQDFTKKVERLSAALKPLSERLTTVKTGLSGFTAKARTAGSSAREMGDQIDAAALNFDALTNNIQTVVQAIQQVVQGFVTVIEQAVEWEGIAARFGRGFGEQAEEIYAYVQKLNEEMGINTQVFMQYSSVYATMLTGFGVASKDASTMALGYMELTYDIWAGYNDIYKSFDDAAEAVRSAIAGEVEPVRRAGFTIVEATLQMTAANHGITQSVETMTEAQKSYLRYLTLVDQAHAQNLVGTYAKELTTAEGLLRTLSQQMRSLAQAVGSLFLPILVRVIPYVQAFVELLTDLVRTLANIVGIEIQEVEWGGFNTGAQEVDKVTDSLGSATKAAKELKNATLGIDELNVISPNTGGAGGGGAGGAGANGFAGLDVDSLWDDSIFDQINTQVDDIVKKMKDWLGITDDIDTWAELMDTRLGTILKTVGAIGTGLMAWKVTKQFLAATATMKDLLSKRSYAITISATLALVGFTLAATGMGDAIQNGLDGVNFGEIIGGSLLTAGASAVFGSKVAGWITTTFAGSKIATALSTAATNLGLGTASAAGGALAAGVSGVILGIPMMFVGIWDACKEGLDWLNGILIPAGGAAAGAGIAAILAAAGTAVSPGIGTLIGLAVGLVIDGVILIVQHWEEIVTWAKGAAKDIKKFVKNIPTYFKDLGKWLDNLPKEIEKWFDNLTDDIDQWFEDLWQPIKDYDWKNLGKNIGLWLGTSLREAWSSVKKKVENFFTSDLPYFWNEWLPDAVQSVADFFLDLPEKLRAVKDSIWDGILDVGKSIINGIWEGMKAGWDAATDFVSGFLDGLKEAFGINSPSTVARDEIGKNIIAGILEAFKPNALVDKLKTLWTNAKNWWDNSKGTLSTYTPSIGDIKSKLSTAWSTAKSWWDRTKSALSTYTPSIGDIKSKLSSAWSTAKTWWDKSKAGFSAYTPSIGDIKGKLSSAWNTAKKWWSNNVKLSVPSLNFKVTYTTKGLNTVQKAITKALGLDGWPKLSFAANGGIFDQGSMIWAGERGAEIVANAAGGRTGVMNVEQMYEAVFEATYSAMMAARGQNDGGSVQAVNVYLDGKRIASGVEKAQKERGTSILGTEVYSH